MLKNRSGVGQADGMRKLLWRGFKYDNLVRDTDRGPLPWAA